MVLDEMDSAKKEALKLREGWTLNLGGAGMLALHSPISRPEAEATILSKLPEGFEAQTFENQAYVSYFAGRLSHFAFASGEEFPLDTACMMQAIPVANGNLRGWLVLNLGIADSSASDYARVALNWPMTKETLHLPETPGDGRVSLQLLGMKSLSMPHRVQGRIRPSAYFAQPDSPEAMLAAQPNLLWKTAVGQHQAGPVYLPPVPIQRIDLDGDEAEKGYLAHYLEHWELIVWRPEPLSAIRPAQARKQPN